MDITVVWVKQGKRFTTLLNVLVLSALKVETRSQNSSEARRNHINFANYDLDTKKLPKIVEAEQGKLQVLDIRTKKELEQILHILKYHGFEVREGIPEQASDIYTSNLEDEVKPNNWGAILLRVGVMILGIGVILFSDYTWAGILGILLGLFLPFSSH